jgi:hypothetical protein
VFLCKQEHPKMETQSDTPDEGFAPDSTIAQYLGIHPKSLPRWDKRPELGFPRPIYFNGRKFRRWSDVKEFTKRAAVAHASKSKSA